MARVSVICPCGQPFETKPSRVTTGRGVYCSRACMYRYRQRPSGLTYSIVNTNRGWFAPGHVSARGEEHPGWKGDDITYKELHRWVRRHKGHPAACERCGGEVGVQWANLSHEYRRDLDDFIALCRACHGHHDAGETRGSATRRFGREAVQNG
jgi:hypothetical protein